MTGVGLLTIFTASIASWFVRKDGEEEGKLLLSMIHSELQQLRNERRGEIEK